MLYYDIAEWEEDRLEGQAPHVKSILYTTGAQKWHIVSLVDDVTSPTTAVHYIWFVCSEYREALLGAPIAHGVHKQCKGEVHSSPLIK